MNRLVKGDNQYILTEHVLHLTREEREYIGLVDDIDIVEILGGTH